MSEPESVLRHLQRLELPDARSQGTDQALEAWIGEGEVRVLPEAPGPDHRGEAGGDLRPGVFHRRDRPEGFVRPIGLFDDLIAIAMADRREGREQGDEPVVATRTKIGDSVPQRLQVGVADPGPGMALDIGVGGITAEPLRYDTLVGVEARMKPQTRRAPAPARARDR